MLLCAWTHIHATALLLPCVLLEVVLGQTFIAVESVVPCTMMHGQRKVNHDEMLDHVEHV